MEARTPKRGETDTEGERLRMLPRFVLGWQLLGLQTEPHHDGLGAQPHTRAVPIPTHRHRRVELPRLPRTSAEHVRTSHQRSGRVQGPRDPIPRHWPLACPRKRQRSRRCASSSERAYGWSEAWCTGPRCAGRGRPSSRSSRSSDCTATTCMVSAPERGPSARRCPRPHAKPSSGAASSRRRSRRRR